MRARTQPHHAPLPLPFETASGDRADVIASMHGNAVLRGPVKYRAGQRMVTARLQRRRGGQQVVGTASRKLPPLPTSRRRRPYAHSVLAQTHYMSYH